VLFLVATCLGIAIKTLAHETLTIGYSDYTVSRNPSIIDLNVFEKQFIAGGGAKASKELAPKGDTCSDSGE
jgi:hypothetical protein